MILEISEKIAQLIRENEVSILNSNVLRKNYLASEISQIIDVELSENGIEMASLTKQLNLVIENSVKTNHPMFMNQMFGKQQSLAVLGDILTSLLNTSMYTFEVAPVMSVIEKECVNRLCNFIWNDSQLHDGVFTPGGSISNMNAMVMAMNQRFPDLKSCGLSKTPPFSIFVSEQAHYSFKKGAAYIGIGTTSLIEVGTDSNGRLDLIALENAIALEKSSGRIPLMIIGVGGTTFSGVFDNLEAISAIANREKMWFHADAAYGGSLLFSKLEAKKMAGIEHADSVTWNLHKMMGIPLTCSVLLTRKERLLNETFSVNADYLFHEENDLDLGRKSIQCGRRVDALKLWTAWKFEGDLGFEKRIDSLMKVTYFFAESVKKMTNFQLLHEPETPIVCFRYCKQEFTENELNQINLKIREIIFSEGEIIFNYSEFKSRIYLRCVFSDPEFDQMMVVDILDRIKLIGDRLSGNIST